MIIMRHSLWGHRLPGFSVFDRRLGDGAPPGCQHHLATWLSHAEILGFASLPRARFALLVMFTINRVAQNSRLFQAIGRADSLAFTMPVTAPKTFCKPPSFTVYGKHSSPIPRVRMNPLDFTVLPAIRHRTRFAGAFECPSQSGN